MSTPFGRQLRAWRSVRRLSQLELSSRAEVAPRHLSFLETGRSRPGEGVVVRLGEALDLPLRARNELLRSAGFDPLYAEEDLASARLQPLREVIDQLLSRHSPLPAFVLDVRWRIVDANRAGRAAALAGYDLPVSSLRVLREGPLRRAMVNWSEVARAAVSRARQDLELHPDEELAEEVARLEREVGPAVGGADPVLITELRLAGTRIRTFTTLCRFSSPRSVAADELQVELVFPADAASRAALEALDRA
jgi:transcriptional regulator with XRE-family HTH domain